jgi:cell wall-associated NlpC family hydrolase
LKGKHSKSRRPLRLNPSATGALVGLAFVGVAATTAAHASILSSGSDGGDKVTAAVATLPVKRTHAKKPAHASSDSRADAKATDDSGSSRSKVIARAETWHPHTDQRIPYSQTSTHNGYRTDCSGFVSMALGLSKPGLNTVGLTSSRYTERIKMSELKKGDLVMDALGTNTTRHVVIFEKWTDSKHTSYWAYEQRGHYGTDHRTRDYGVSSDSEYKAYRPTNL